MSVAVHAKQAAAGARSQAKAAPKSAANGLRIGGENDAFEWEADRMALRAARAGGAVSSGSGGGGTRFAGTAPAGNFLRRKAAGPAPGAQAPEIVGRVLGEAGRPLDGTTRRYFEPRFARDFSAVRIHADERAAESADAVNAHAYTVGNHVVFGRGRYGPSTEDGRRLLAHELTHVAQQDPGSAAPRPFPRLGDPGDPLEAEARDAQRSPAPLRLAGLAQTGVLRREEKPAEAGKPTAVGLKKVEAAIRLLQHARDYYLAKPPDKERALKLIKAVQQFTHQIVNDEAIRKNFQGFSSTPAQVFCGSAKSAVDFLEQSYRIHFDMSDGTWQYRLNMYASARPFLEVLAGDPSIKDLELAPAINRAANTTLMVSGAIVVGLAAVPLVLEGAAVLGTAAAETGAGARVLSFVLTQPAKALLITEFTAGTVLNIEASGGIKNWLDGLSTPEGAAWAAFQLVELTFHIQMAGGGTRQVRVQGTLESHDETGVRVKITSVSEGQGETPTPQPAKPAAGGQTAGDPPPSAASPVKQAPTQEAGPGDPPKKAPPAKPPTGDPGGTGETAPAAGGQPGATGTRHLPREFKMPNSKDTSFPETSIAVGTPAQRAKGQVRARGESVGPGEVGAQTADVPGGRAGTRDHWGEHGHEFPEYRNARQYEQGAIDFCRADTTRRFYYRYNGRPTIGYYDPSTNTFAASSVDGATIYTYFRPANVVDYVRDLRMRGVPPGTTPRNSTPVRQE